MTLPTVYARALDGAVAGYAPPVALTRSEQKERTRRALLDAALARGVATGLGGLSLRQVAKDAGIVPTAFYRHFDSLDDLGLTLVTESFASLREMMREVRRGDPAPAEIIARSVGILVAHVRERREHFAFIAREEAAGPPIVRRAVRDELDRVERELTTDLARLASRWSHEDLQILAHLIVGTMVNTVRDLLAAGSAPAEDAVARTAERQLRMIVVGALQWRSDYQD